MDNNSDDSLSTTNSGVSYQPLKDPDLESERSSLNIPISRGSHSLHSLPDYLSESSQNLLTNDDEVDGDMEIISSKEFDQSEDTFTPTVVKPPVLTNIDRVETESMQSSSDTYLDIRGSNSEDNLLSEVSELEAAAIESYFNFSNFISNCS